MDHGGTVAGPLNVRVLMPDAESIRLVQHALNSTFIVMLVFAVLIVPACFFVPNPRWAADMKLQAKQCPTDQFLDIKIGQ